MELLKVYPKDITLMVEVPLKELENLLDYLERAEVVYNGETEPVFKMKAQSALNTITSLNQICDSVKGYSNES
jgi:hypothetical protein